MRDKDWTKVFRTGGRQEGVVTLAQIVDCGVPASTFFDVAHRFGMSHLGFGVWSLPTSTSTYRRKLWVVKLALGDEVTFTGRSALWLRRIITANPQQVDVLLPPAMHQRPRPGVRFHRGRPLDDDPMINIEVVHRLRVPLVHRRFVRGARGIADARRVPAMDRLRLGNLDGLDEYSLRQVRRRGRRTASPAARSGADGQGTRSEAHPGRLDHRPVLVH